MPTPFVAGSLRSLRVVPFAVVAAACFLLAAKDARAQDPVVPEWAPGIDQAIQQLEGILDTLQQQQPMNYTQANVAMLYDAKLYMLFHSWEDFLTGDERVQQMGEQRRWLKRREEAADSAAAVYSGGTLAPYAAGTVTIEMTKARIAEIEARLVARLERWETERRKGRK